jgi:tetratricopeptide (TPR) repeat protein
MGSRLPAAMTLCVSLSCFFAASLSIAEEPGSADRFSNRLWMPKSEHLLQPGKTAEVYQVLELPFSCRASAAQSVRVRSSLIDQRQFVPIENAVEYYTTLIEKEPNNSWALTLRALAVLRTTRELGPLDSADHDVAEAIRIKPDYVPAHQVRGIVLFCKEEFELSVKEFEKGLRLAPRNAANYLGRGIARRAQGKHREAIGDFSEAIRLDPRMTMAYEERGYTLAEQGDRNKASADFKMAISLDPTNSEPLYLYMRASLSGKNEGFHFVPTDFKPESRNERDAPSVMLIGDEQTDATLPR